MDKKVIKPTMSVEPTIDHKTVMANMSDKEHKKALDNISKFMKSELDRQLEVSLLRPPYPTFQRVKVSEEEINHCCPLWFKLK